MEMDYTRVKEILSTKKISVPNGGWQFKKCPFCGSNEIGVKDSILDFNMGHDCPSTARKRIWAYCRYCGAEGPKTVQDIVGDSEEIASAIVKWNERSYFEGQQMLKRITGVNWQYCKNLNDINDAIVNQDKDWDGLDDANKIISITYDANHSSYVVFWKHCIESEAAADD